MIKRRKEKTPRWVYISLGLAVMAGAYIMWYLYEPSSETLEQTYANQINNRAVRETFTLGDGIYYEKRSMLYFFSNSASIKPLPRSTIDVMESENYYIIGNRKRVRWRSIFTPFTNMRLYSKTSATPITEFEKLEISYLTDKAVYYNSWPNLNNLYRYDIKTGETKLLLEGVLRFRLLQDDRIAFVTNKSWDDLNLINTIYCYDNGEIFDLAKYYSENGSPYYNCMAYEDDVFYYQDGQEIKSYSFKTKKHELIYSDDNMIYLQNIFNGKLYLSGVLKDYGLECYTYNLKTKEKLPFMAFGIKDKADLENAFKYLKNCWPTISVLTEDLVFCDVNGMLGILKDNIVIRG